MNVPITQLKRPELLKLCRSYGFHNYSRLSKKDLLCLLSENSKQHLTELQNSSSEPYEVEEKPHEQLTESQELPTKSHKPHFAFAILRHYFMYPILTTIFYNTIAYIKN